MEKSAMDELQEMIQEGNIRLKEYPDRHQDSRALGKALRVIICEVYDVLKKEEAIPEGLSKGMEVATALLFEKKHRKEITLQNTHSPNYTLG